MPPPIFNARDGGAIFVARSARGERDGAAHAIVSWAEEGHARPQLRPTVRPWVVAGWLSYIITGILKSSRKAPFPAWLRKFKAVNHGFRSFPIYITHTYFCTQVLLFISSSPFPRGLPVVKMICWGGGFKIRCHHQNGKPVFKIPPDALASPRRT